MKCNLFISWRLCPYICVYAYIFIHICIHHSLHTRSVQVLDFCIFRIMPLLNGLLAVIPWYPIHFISILLAVGNYAPFSIERGVFFWMSQKWNYTISGILCNRILSMFIHIIQNTYLISCYWEIVHCVGISHLMYSFPNWWDIANNVAINIQVHVFIIICIHHS